VRITDVRIRQVSENGGKLKAYCSLVFDGMLAVHDFRVIDGVNGLFVAMPSRKINGAYREMVHPVSPEARSLIQRVVLAAYRSVQEPPVEAAAAGVEQTLPEGHTLPEESRVPVEERIEPDLSGGCLGPLEPAQAEMEAMPA